MTECVEKTGTLGCPYEAHGSEPFPERCYRHAKERAGLFTCLQKGCSRPSGHRPPCSPVPSERRTTSADGVFSDEHQEIMRVLRREGAVPTGGSSEESS